MIKEDEDFIIDSMNGVIDLFEFDVDVTVIVTPKEDDDEVLMYSTCDDPATLIKNLEKIKTIHFVGDKLETDLDRH